MAKLIMFLSCLLLYLTGYSQELKGIKLGSYTKISVNKPMYTTLAGYDYALVTLNLKNGRCCAIMALPVENNLIRRIPVREFQIVAQALSEKFPGESRYIPDERDPDNKNIGTIFLTSDTYETMLWIKDYDYYSNTYEASIRLCDIELFQIYRQEQLTDL